MTITCYAPSGFEGHIVEAEVDIRRGIPSVDIVGLPDGAVREARDRIRVSITNSGYRFPRDRVLINLSPADVRKEGASFDLPIALAVMHAAGLIGSEVADTVMAVGELQLSGEVRPVRGVLSAVASALAHGITTFVVPDDNLSEALALDTGRAIGVSTLREAAQAISGDRTLTRRRSRAPAQALGEDVASLQEPDEDFSDIRGHRYMKRALAAAAAGKHHVLLFGPPGSGKTMAARRLPTILPDLTRDESVEVTRIHSIAGLLPRNTGLLRRPPFRSPHHSASSEGLVGGGRHPRPGEVSLAHKGVLLLDEAPEFRKNLLQCLREPIESGAVDIVRAGQTCWYPAEFQLVMTANPCPCGNRGKDDATCLCSSSELVSYWKKLGGALMDRIDIRIPVKPAGVGEMMGERELSSAELRIQVEHAVAHQRERFRGRHFDRNGRIPPGLLPTVCPLSPSLARDFIEAVRKLSLSSRACHSILKVARTLSDLDGARTIEKGQLFEAIQFRRYGDTDFFWMT